MTFDPAHAVQLAAELFSDDEEAPEDWSPAMPARIGRYRVRRLIGTGGMGAVYEAEQEQPHRTVAVKVMRQGTVSSTARRRFEVEGEVLARLTHPGIAHVYETGYHDDGAGGVPFFAMEYVRDACDILQYADDHHLNTAERLRLFVRVCDAVQYGHQQGVIHRDLKPANILIDADGHPKIIDFGVARTTDADITLTTMHTGAGQLVGTIQYMSPEQATGEIGQIDTRSDVYALGMVLYELLTGRLPYDLSDVPITMAARIITEGRTPSPSSVVSRLRGDMEAVTLKALEKDRARRYQSASEFAADIRRFLDGEPVVARRPGRWLRAMRWVMRHPIAATAVLCLSMVVLTAAATASATAGVVWYLRNVPAGIRLSGDESYAELVTHAGIVLDSWRLANKDTRYTRLINAEWPGRKGRRLTIMHLEAVGGSSRCPIVCIDPRRHHEPIWLVDNIDVPDGLNYVPEEGGFEFNLKRLYLWDIFEEVAGDEVVTVATHVREACSCVQIRSLVDGAVLYEIWNYGHISDVLWVSESGQLVVMAAANTLRLGDEPLPKGHAICVFALSPQLHHRSDQWIVSPDSASGENPLWMNVLEPADAYEYLSQGHLEPFDEFDAKQCVRVEPWIRYPMVRADGPHWVIDEAGRMMTETGTAAADPRGALIRFEELALQETRGQGIPDPREAGWGWQPVTGYDGPDFSSETQGD
jgi:hypothetical protein